MKSRSLLVLTTGLFIMACAGDTAEEGMAENAAAEASSATMTADEAAIEQLRADYVQHYNMHHASVVADLWAEDAVWLGADGTVAEGKAEILAGLEADMAGTPTLNLTTREHMVFGDNAVTLGEYTVDVNADGTPMTSAGYYMSVATRVDGAWKLTGVVTNFNATPPEGMAYVESTDTEPPPEEGTMADMVAAYETHFNLGHAGMVADLYTDDAIAALANRSAVEGRAAIEALMSERMAAGSPQIDLHDVGTWDLGEGWAVDGGWYSMTATGPDGPVATMGAYMSLVQQQADGTWKIHRVVTNAQPAPAG